MHSDFRKWLVSKEFSEKVLGIIVDEAHCVSEWGGDFRPRYSEVQKLRSFVPTSIPILLTSATLPPATIVDLQRRFSMKTDEIFMLNLGNGRPNIHKSVRFITSAKDFSALLDLLEKPDDVKSKHDIKKTLIFTNEVLPAQQIVEYLRKHYGPKFEVRIDYLHSRRTRDAKRLVIERFQSGSIRILVATEAAGMVSDIELQGCIYQLTLVITGR